MPDGPIARRRQALVAVDAAQERIEAGEFDRAAANLENASEHVDELRDGEGDGE